MSNTSPLKRARKHWLAGRSADQQRRWDAALHEYEKAARLAPREGLYSLSLATAALQQSRFEQAEAAARKALALQRDLTTSRLLAHVLTQQNRHSEAADVLLGLPSTVKRDATLLMEQADALHRGHRLQEAVPVYLECLRQNPRNPAAYHRLGMAFMQIQRPKDAAICLETAAATDTGAIRTQSLSLLVQMLRRAAEWSDLQRHTEALLDVVQNGSPEDVMLIEPFTLLPIPSTPQQQRRAGKAYSRRLCGTAQPLPPISAPASAKNRVRIGYLSADFCNHATAHLLSELLELHDRSRFEIFLYCHSPEDGSHWQSRVRAAAEHYRDVRQLSDQAVAERMRADGLDIAVDLKGYTQDTRMQILAYRPAPVQLGYLGYPATTGCDFIDYLLGDPIVTPLAHAEHFSERIAQMPHSYQPNDSRRVLPAKPARAELGLPDDAVVLCTFNQTYKVSPEMADLWARILHAAPNTVLWQLNFNDQASANLVRQLQARGVTPERLYFSALATSDEHLARLQCADLMLDTWPYNAHTTASDALWCGVPVLTVPGQTFASRVAASLLTACDLPQFVCADAEHYVERAVALASEPGLLAAAQQHLAARRDQLPLFDSRRYARDFEALLQRMWDRHAQGLAPDHLEAAAT